MAEVTLRPIDDSDLDALFDQMRDPESVRMAAFTAGDPTTAMLSTLMSNGARSRLSSSARAVLVAAMNRRLTAERLVAVTCSATA